MKGTLSSAGKVCLVVLPFLILLSTSLNSFGGELVLGNYIVDDAGLLYVDSTNSLTGAMAYYHSIDGGPTLTRGGVFGSEDLNGNYGILGYQYFIITAGVFGKGVNSGASGVRGEAGTGSGVFGVSSSGYGVAGQSTSSYGVYGYSSSSYAGWFQGDVNITGALYKGTDHFAQPHPTDPKKEVVYAAVEGPEHAIFLRGTAKLIDGKAVIETPEYFRVVAGSDGITVQFTPRSGKSKGLAAAEVRREKISVEELMDGKGTYDFDYFITAKRAGFEAHEPIQANTHFKADNISRAEFESRYSRTDDMTIAAMRKLLISNGILTPEGKLNMDTVARLGWTVKDSDLADADLLHQKQ